MKGITRQLLANRATAKPVQGQPHHLQAVLAQTLSNYKLNV